MSDQPRTPFSFGSKVWPGTSKMVEEFGDVLAAALFFIGHNLDADEVWVRAFRKQALFERWHGSDDDAAI